jgi:outer membrane protein TolC
MSTCRALAVSMLLGIGPLPTWGAPPVNEITAERAVASRFPHPAELEVAEGLAAAERRLAGARGLLFQGATVSAATGPRRSDEAGRSNDLSLGVDLPLLFARDDQRAAVAALEAATPVLSRAARAEADLDVELAYLAAWRDAEEVDLRERELALVGEWLAVVERRVEAGAEPPFRTTVALGERERVATQRDLAGTRALASRLALDALSPLPGDELKWIAPAVDRLADPGSGLGVELQRRAIELWTDLELAVAGLDSKVDTARWAVTSELAREGEEEVALVGLTYRIAPRRERPTSEAALLAARDAVSRRRAIEIANLEGRIAAARRALEAPPSTLSETEIERAFRALAALVAEGKERPTEVLAERRALVDARIAQLDRLYARAVASAELRTLTRRFEP